ncbi:MAG TPA: hypothetical protein VHO50_10315 [Bacteroidales bacterium]|nr:hypothetical protein [Bacteroidales bacterium]
MKKAFASVLFLFLFISLQAQQFYIQYGPVLSQFDYVDSEGEELGDLRSSNKNSLGAGGRISLFHTPAHISLGLSNDRFASTSTDPILGNYSEWDASFLGINFGADYEFFKPEIRNIDRNGFSFCLKAGMSADILINGKQKLNNQLYDLKNVEEFDEPVWFVKGGVIFNYYFTRSYKAFVEYMFGKSFLIGDYTNQEQLKYTTHSIGLGFSVDLFYRRNK